MQVQVKVGDLGMARHVVPPVAEDAHLPQHSPATTPSATQPFPPLAAAGGGGRKGQADELLLRKPMHTMSGAATAINSSSGISGTSVPKGPAFRTFTPGVVGTITYTAPEVLGVLDDHLPDAQQAAGQPSVEQVLKVSVDRLPTITPCSMQTCCCLCHTPPAGSECPFWAKQHLLALGDTVPALVNT